MSLGSWRTPMVVLTCGTAILCISFGVRQNFGLYMAPISTDMGWGRETFAFAVAMQSQAKAQEALNELDPETRKRMIERVLADEQARLPQSKEVVPTQLVQGPGDEDDDDIREEGRQI